MMHNNANRIAHILPVILLCLAAGLSSVVRAAEAPDLDKTGSLAVEMKYNGSAIPGFRIAVYRVADASPPEGDGKRLVYGAAPPFGDAGVDLTDFGAFDSAQNRAAASTLRGFVAA
jgi:hypothetical protein